MLMDQKSGSRSCSTNFHSRKISIGILADAACDVEPISRPTGMVAKQAAGLQKQVLRQASKSYSRKNVGADSPVFCVTSQPRPLENAFSDHCAHPFAGANGTENDAFIDNKSQRSADSGNGRKYKKSEHVQNPVSLVQPIQLENNVADEGREIKIAGHETLRMKLLEVLGNVPSPIKSAELNIDKEKEAGQRPEAMISLSSDAIESDSDKKSPGKPIKRYTSRKKALPKNEHQKVILENSTSTKKDVVQKTVLPFNGDQHGSLCGNSKDKALASTMEIHEGSKHAAVRSKHHSETRSRSSTAVEKFVEVSNADSLKVRAKDKSSDQVISTRKVMDELQTDIEQPQDVKTSTDQPVDLEYREGYFPQKEIYNAMNRKKIGVKESTTDPLVGEKNNSFNSPLKTMAEIWKNEQSPAVGIFKDKLDDKENRAKSLFGKRTSKMNDAVLGASNSKKKNDPTGVERQPMDVEHSNFMNQQTSISNPLSKKRRVHSDDHPNPQSWIDVIGPLVQSNGNLMGDTPADNIFSFINIRNFKSLCSSKSFERRQREMDELHNDTDGNMCFPIDPTFNMDVGGNNRVQGSSNNGMDSESLGNDSPLAGDSEGGKDCRELMPSSPEIHRDKKIQNDTDRTPDNEKDDDVTETQESTPPVSLDKNINDDLGSGVTLLIMALDRVKSKLSSLTTKRCVSILRASSEEIHSLMQNAESQIKGDTSKLTNLCHLKRELLETKFQEKQEHLMGVFKRFKEEIAQQLQGYQGLVDDLEEHKVDLKRTVERQGAVHKKIVSQVDQEIDSRIQDAESKILAVQKWNQDKMLQLKTVVAELMKSVAF